MIASSQGSDSYVVYDHRDRDRYVTTFRIRGGRVDGTSHTDGVHATGEPLGSRYPRGLFVAQDGANERGRQNFKLVDWREVARRL